MKEYPLILGIQVKEMWFVHMIVQYKGLYIHLFLEGQAQMRWYQQLVSQLESVSL
jgi:hypothetical protein